MAIATGKTVIFDGEPSHWAGTGASPPDWRQDACTSTCTPTVSIRENMAAQRVRSELVGTTLNNRSVSLSSSSSSSSNLSSTPSTSTFSSTPSSRDSTSSTSSKSPIVAKHVALTRRQERRVDQYAVSAYGLYLFCKAVVHRGHMAALDVETIDGTSQITEIGIATWDGKEGSVSQHWHYHITDYDHVPRRFCTGGGAFRYGRTQSMSLAQAVVRINRWLAWKKNYVEGKAKVPSCVILHAGAQDKRWLAENGIDLEPFNVLDTSEVDMHFRFSDSPLGGLPMPRKLKVIADSLGVSPMGNWEHNAGNDAAVALFAAKGLMRERCVPLAPRVGYGANDTA